MTGNAKESMEQKLDRMVKKASVSKMMMRRKTERRIKKKVKEGVGRGERE